MALKLHSRVKKLYMRLRVYRSFLRNERAVGGLNPFSLGRYRYFLAGLNSDKRYLYTHDPDLRNYWSDFDCQRTRAFNKAYGMVFDRKDILHRVLARMNVGPRVLGLVRDGFFYPEDGTEPRRLHDAPDCLPAQFLLRKVGPSFSRGMYWVCRRNGQWLFNEHPVEEGRLLEFLGEGWWMAFEHLEQAASGYAAGIFPQTPNFLHLTVLRCHETGAPYCAFATQMIGAARCPAQQKTVEHRPEPERRYDRYAFSAPVGLEAGVLGDAVELEQQGARWDIRFHSAHPQSKANIAGVQVDDWQAAKLLVEEVTTALPMINAVTWTLLHTDKGFIIVDGSNRLDVVNAQLHGPLLEDQPIRDFHHKHLLRRQEQHLSATAQQ